MLSWQIQTDEKMNKYEVWRSDDGRSFYKLTEFTATSSASYAYNDVNAIRGSVYYYVKAIKKDGAYYNSATVKLNDEDIWLSISPNPARNSFAITLPSSVTHFTLVVKDLAGNSVIHNRVTGNYKLVNISFLPAGVYVAAITYPGGTRVIKKIMKQ